MPSKSVNSNRPVKSCFALLAIILASALTGQPAAAGQTVEIHRRAVGENDGAWQIARATQGGFSVEIPAMFNDFSLRGEDANTGAYVVHGVGGRAPNNVKFTVTLMPITAKMKRPDMATIASGYAKPGDKMSEVTHTKGPDGESVTFTVLRSNAYAAVRYTLNAQGLITQVMESPLAEADSAKQWQTRFLESLKTGLAIE